MMDFLYDFHFLRPLLLLFLLLPVALYLKKIKIATGASSWEDVCDKNLLNFLLVNNSNAKRISVKKFIYTALIFGTLAAAGPCWKKEEIPTFSIENPNMFILSLAQDMQLKDIPPSRLERAKFMLSDITEGLNDGQFGVAVYSNEPYVISPITDDVRLIKNLLPQITPDIVPDQGDRLDRAIDLAFERFKTAGYASGNIILFASDVGQRFDLALEKAKLAHGNHYNIHIVDTSYSGNEKLKLIADAGGGVYMSVKELSVDKLLDRLNTLNNERLTITENLRSNYLDFGYYLLFIPLVCMLVFFRRGLLALFFCCVATQAYADFWKNDNQEGYLLFQEGQYEEAVKKFTDTNWKGVSFYKQDDYENALKEFSKQSDEIALYNQGVVLVKLCKYEEALKLFDTLLQKNPQYEDARYNKQVLTELFEKSKTDPSVLDCNNDQQQNEQNQNQNNQDQQNDNQNQQEKNKENSDNDNSQQSNENKQEQNDQQENQNNSDNSQNTDSNKDETEEQNNENQQSGNNQDKSNNNQNQQDSSENQNDNSSPDDSQNTPQPANSDEGNENKSHNNDGENQAGNEKQNTEQNAPLANMKKGDENEKYDEEALAMQRRYREIPEDVGGLLREFIKKEYMKDRYKNENM